VAIDRSDKHHARCAALLESPKAAFLTSVATGESQQVAITAVDLERTAELVRGYAGLPLGAADASVIAVAELLKLTDVATLDRRHFTVVRPKHAAAVNLC
jgi:predicted nucleic acid-binding protein